MAYSDDSKWDIPAKYRVSTDMTDEAAHALLLQCDAEQARLSQMVVSPFSRNSPRDMYRRKAKITIDSLLKTQEFQTLTDDQIEILAESYAQIGRYDLAAETTKLNADHYAKIWEAIFKDDDEECPHKNAKLYVSEYVWSIRDQKEVALPRCNICGHLNGRDKPAHLVAATQARAVHQGKTAGMSMNQIIQYHKANVKPPVNNGR